MSPHHYLFAFKNADLGTKLGLLPDVFLINLRRYRGDPLLDDPETHLPAIDRLGGGPLRRFLPLPPRPRAGTGPRNRAPGQALMWAKPRSRAGTR